MQKKLLNVLSGNISLPPPIWLMRQAGRYLPEYREVRSLCDNFLNLCYTPRYACEVTLQPLRRFSLDAAIIFSDILVVPDALGVKVEFKTGEGPLLSQISCEDISRLKVNGFLKHLQPVFETISLVKSKLPPSASLIGFCGAPWTVATYMIAGKSTQDQAPARIFSYQHRKYFETLLDILSEVSAQYLIEQIKAGAEVVQIFDSWAGVLTEQQFKDFCIKPTARIVKSVKKQFPNIPIIGFPKGVGILAIKYFVETEIDAISLDWTVPLSLCNFFPENAIFQGNLDPLALLSGGKALEDSVKEILKKMEKKSFIFNLGHGILPQTPIEHVKALIDMIKGENFSYEK